ncbi:long-chain fatty acid--CoA ligase [Rhodococcus sp. Q]|uniref:AMP-dependent synthetase/ligase n=1 Tax=Rhodococcus sp. Q TaxID=2502252 RepID=UPI0010F50C4E|nr:long-chain fatty acid--CoA ligase [Rhodococcus sp. Q]
MSLDTLCAAFQDTVARHPDKIALRTPDDSVEITWREYSQRVRAIAAGLVGLGVRQGDTVGLMLTNRPEFHLVDTATLHAGATPFSVYNTLAAEQLRHVLNNAGNRVMVCESQYLPVIEQAVPGTAVEHIVCVDGAADGTIGLADVESNPDPEFDFDASWRAVRPDDLITIIYTSGTTGPSKGVELTHANIASFRDAVADITHPSPDDRIVSYLPDAHIANRCVCHYNSILFATELTTLADMKQATTVLPQVRPTVFFAVPQVWYKVKAGVEAAIDAETGAKKKLAQWAVDVGMRVARMRSAGVPVPHRLELQHAAADRLVLSSIRRKLGMDEVRLAATAAAPMSPDVLTFILGLGIPCCEAWGLSETTALTTMNRPGAIRIGTVGEPVTGVTLKLADDGELLVSGPGVMRGYRGEPEKTAEALDADGWLHTGDVATIDADGYVTIVDRKKELIVTTGGKNISPAAIEDALHAASPLIAGAVAIGDARPYVTALLTLDPDVAAAFAGSGRSPSELADSPEVRAEIDRAVAAANSQLSHVEQVKKFALLPDVWEPGGEEFTPTLKLRRKPIADKYARQIEDLYAG